MILDTNGLSAVAEGESALEPIVKSFDPQFDGWFDVDSLPIMQSARQDRLMSALRAFGMGVFLSAYYVITAPAPAIAGWIYDRSGDPYLPILFAIVLFALTLAANFAFRFAERRARQAAAG